MTFNYTVEVLRDERWVPITTGTRSYCMGFFDARLQLAPRLAMRVVRNGVQDKRKVLAHAPAKDTVSIGQIAGFPTAEQYEAAAAKALAAAQYIRSRASSHPS
ncbi:MAG: hypothetical protein VKI63_04195 [Cyanobium sp.]|nr:hypothetical protein [Cyanobium sp.]